MPTEVVGPALDPEVDEMLNRLAAGLPALKPSRGPRKHWGRQNAKRKRFVCAAEPTPLHAAAILWPPGVPHKGCGRVFRTAKGLAEHPKNFDDPDKWPYGCLSEILPADEREVF